MARCRESYVSEGEIDMKSGKITLITLSILMLLMTSACAETYDKVEGCYLEAVGGQPLIIVDANGANQAFPCVMTAADDAVGFDKLNDGDRIRIAIDAIAESYPAKTRVYDVELLSRGEVSDIDAELLASLYELGWLDDESKSYTDMSNETDNTDAAKAETDESTLDAAATMESTHNDKTNIAADTTAESKAVEVIAETSISNKDNPDMATVDVIHDISDWELLGLESYMLEDSLIYDLVSGSSEFIEYNDLDITDYTITRLTPVGQDPLLRFEFTVTGDSLPETLPPGKYTKLVEYGYYCSIYDEPKPETQAEYEAYIERKRGLDVYGNLPEVQALAVYFDWTGGWNIARFGEWELTDYSIQAPIEYIIHYFGDDDKLGYKESERLLSEKFGIEITPVEAEIKAGNFLERCQYNSDTNELEFSSTLNYGLDYRISDVEADGGETLITVQFYTDHNQLLPMHKVSYRIGENLVFLGSELLSDSPYLLPYMY